MKGLVCGIGVLFGLTVARVVKAQDTTNSVSPSQECVLAPSATCLFGFDDVQERPQRDRDFRLPISPRRNFPPQGEVSVKLRFIIDASGRVEPNSVEIVSAPDSDYAAAARATILEFHYSPGRRYGIAVRTRVSTEIEYTGPSGKR